MLKLYKRIDDQLHYHEGWNAGEYLVEHRGIFGQTGEAKEHPLTTGLSEADRLAQMLRSAMNRGFEPIHDDDMASLFVVYSTGPRTSRKDLRKRHAIEDRLNHFLGWNGCGACDGGDAGSGKMEVSCQVVDFDIAKRVIESELSGTDFGDFTDISTVPSLVLPGILSS